MDYLRPTMCQNLAMINLSKCFDTIDHGTLLHILELYGVNTKWFRSYLSGHTQSVQVKGSDGETLLSKPANNPIGIYQGTALGPLLFSIFSNDMYLHCQTMQKSSNMQMILS